MVAITELLTQPWTIVFLVVSLLQIYHKLTAKSKIPDGVPWVGRDSSRWFAGTRASLSSFGDTQQLLAQGYQKLQYLENGISYLMPNPTGKPDLIVPPSQLHWAIEQPDDVLSAAAFHYDILGEDYAFSHPKILRDPYHEHTIHKYLPRRLPGFIPDIQDEVAAAFDKSWGTDEGNWKEISVFDANLFMISRVVNRMIIGHPLCRNEEFLSNMRSYSMGIQMISMIITYTPKLLKPLVGRLAALRAKAYYNAMAKFIIPIVTERLANLEKKEQDPAFDWEPPNDFISWHIAGAKADGRHDELTVNMLSRRIMPIEFASIHTTTIAVTHCMFDLLSSEDCSTFLEGIREQSTSLLSSNDGQWAKANLAHASRADSAFRESLRISSFMTRSVARKVVSKQGLQNPAEGWTAPYGTIMSFDLYDVHRDPRFYPQPNIYDAFRFSRQSEIQANASANGSTGQGEAKEGSRPERKNLGLITLSDTFLTFGLGRHACPGRFFISAEAKIMLAYMVMNYEIKTFPTRPADRHLSSIILPSSTAKIRVRRRAGTGKAH
ncbi:uncharacterized protein KY384_007876 [Bacidia gigantensis]|uniref:uncharacterized protein n=1 Tax=Bacidia gigantensis TaxID=2732470 RepID=UPI001D045ACD|nr:uncharacterized protein KY384_007876 [Bacidia gigantensis]KAG8527722.1 hypothetical protein KY384_007876 [Bacidia gigantensis]